MNDGDDLLICADCQKSFETSGRTRIPVAFCKPCRKLHSKDIVEFILEPLNVKSYSINQLVDAEQFASSLFADVRLDLHGVLDTVEPNVPLGLPYGNDACCISFVGALTTTRITARKNVIERIAKGQISFGVLVFKRGPRKNKELCNAFQEPGSKAWINALIKGGKLFIDDSLDHVFSVESIGIPGLVCKHFNVAEYSHTLIEFLKNFYHR